MASTADDGMASTADESTASTADESMASTADEDSMLEEGEAAEASGPIKEKKLKKKKKKASLESETSGTVFYLPFKTVFYQCFCSVLLPDPDPRLDPNHWRKCCESGSVGYWTIRIRHNLYGFGSLHQQAKKERKAMSSTIFLLLFYFE
jgi:hypothetical protein